MDDARVKLLSDLADPTRFGVLERLEAAPATATELAQALESSPTQLANHLRRLREAGLVTVTHRGRMAYYELAEPGLREIFSMLNGLRGPSVKPSSPAPPAITCYDHLAGRLGVALHDHFVAEGALVAREGEGELELGERAEAAFASLGVALPDEPSRRMLAYACMDSRVGRAHTGGLLGARLLSALRERGWVEDAGPRQLDVTRAGRQALRRRGIDV